MHQYYIIPPLVFHIKHKFLIHTYLAATNEENPYSFSIESLTERFTWLNVRLHEWFYKI